MAVCEFCQQEMRFGVSCTVECYDGFADDPRSYQRIRYESNGGRCHDCGCPLGGLHHPGCDVEECPKCGGQAISCDCTQKKDDE